MQYKVVPVSSSQASPPLSVESLGGAHLAPPRRSGLTQREFVAEYQCPRLPVILTDATRNWSALSWTPDVLRHKAGQRPVTIRTPHGSEVYLVDKLCDLIEASSVGQPAPYARNVDVERELPELWNDIQPRLEFAQPDWKSSALLPRDFVFSNGLVELFFGGAGSSFPRLHVDYWGMDGFFAQIYGAKEFILLAPDQTPFVYPDEDGGQTSQIESIDPPDYDRFPLFRQAQVIQFFLQPGETLYLPNGWWHTTYMPEVSMTAITATWQRHNWGRFMQQYRIRGKTRGLAKLAALIGLKALGLGLGARDVLQGR